MKPTGPIPPHFSADNDGQLMVGGRAVDEIIDEAGDTPLFVYDNNIIGGQIARFRAAMPDGVALFYSVTANPCEELLRFVGRYVDGFRVVSAGELDVLKRAELGGIAIKFAGPAKRDRELEAGIAAGATISIESEGEASRAIRAGERLGIRPSLAVRVNPPFAFAGGQFVPGARPSPFGVDAERVPALVRGLIEADVDWRGLHIFTGSQCLDAGALIQAHQAIVTSAGEIAQALDLPLPELNLGGSFDVPRLPGEQPLNIEELAGALHKTVCNAEQHLATTRFSVELGRWLTAEAGVYLTRVVDRSISGGRTFLTTDGGGHHWLGATGCLQERGSGNYPICVAGRFGADPEEDVTVTGCLATPNDLFGDDVSLPHADVGDVIAIFCAGAYGLTASPQSWESRPPARELLV